MSEYLAIAQEAARKAANVTMDYYTRKLTVSIKKDRTPVTDADHAAEKIIIDTIMHKFPDHAFYGEETGRTGESDEFMWLIDPIDGTKNFIAEIPLWGILIALMHKGEIIVGVSYLPILGEMLCAEKGEGAFVNGENIHVSKTTKMAKGMISFGSLGAFKKAGLDQQALALIYSSHRQRSFGDLYPFHLLAEGKLEAVVEAQIRAVDVAPFVVIVKEAGGRTSDLTGKNFDLDISSFVATNGHVQAEVLSHFTG
jgi:histidinol-phosphatase